MKKYIWGGDSSHDEGPALTARFTGGQVNGTSPRNTKKNINVNHVNLVEVRMEGPLFDLFYGGRGPPLRGGGQGGGSGGGSDPPPKWGSRFGVFFGVKKWSKMAKKGAGRRGKQKCVFRG